MSLSGADASTSATDASAPAATDGEAFEPEDWIGAYHQIDDFVAFGRALPHPQFPGGLLTLELLDDDSATLEEQYCDQDHDRVTRYRWEPVDAQRVRLLPAADDEVLRFGATPLESLLLERVGSCGELHMVLDEGATRLRWGPGAACWVNRCEDPVDAYELGYCEGEEPPPCP